MEVSNRKISSGRLFSIVFHLILWTIWIGLPIINAGDNERFRIFSIWLIPVTLTNIPHFLLNTEWLIPKVLKKYGVMRYVVGLLLLTAVFTLVHYFMKEWIIPEEIRFNRNDWFWAVVPVLFVTAISTGYGFITYLIKQEKEEQEEHQERLQSELSFLRSQISPHFIFNVLNSIVYLIRNNPQLAENVTIRLSELMRYMLYTAEKEQHPLSRELEYLQNYLNLQQIRFEEDVDIRFQLEGQAGTQLIEPMILIPFVENAFKHGVGMLSQPVIDVQLKLSEDSLYFRVRNKISPEPMEDKDFSSGIGLKNVRRRLELLYPHTHQLGINEQEGWFEVKLSLEFHHQESPAIRQNQPQTHENSLSGSR